MYKITNLLNNKIYIGQTINPSKRWSGHKNQAKSDRPKQIISVAMKKYGIENFIFEIIAICTSYEDANSTEAILISQYNCIASNGYNLSLGGETAPKSEEFKQKMRDWHASLSEEEKEKRRMNYHNSIILQIADKGHPAKNRIVTQEEKELHRKARLEKPLEYTEELRHKMSESHIGHIDSDDTKNKKSESAKIAWNKRLSYDDIKCAASGCDVCGKHKYMIVQGIRYCSKHGFRMLRYGRLNTIR
jgi:group I intron endonuclease